MLCYNLVGINYLQIGVITLLISSHLNQSLSISHIRFCISLCIYILSAMRLLTRIRLLSFTRNFHLNEPVEGFAKTAVPGPRTKQLLKDLHSVQNQSIVHLFANYQKSCGNYLVDADGNTFLDTFMQFSTLSLGYNHPALIQVAQSQESITTLVNRPSLGVFPAIDFVDKLQNSLLDIAPRGFTHVQQTACGACAVENALKHAFIKFRDNERGGLYSDIDMSSCLKNQSPGSPDISVLSFSGAFHGRTFGALSLTRSKAIHKVDIPAFPFPVAPFPELKYPLEAHAAENSREEARCLDAVRDLIKEWKNIKNSPISAIIVEPIQSEGGDRHASVDFFRNIRKICTEENIAFIVDEVQTCGGNTGRMWAHEAWDLETLPDIVLFAKKMHTAGYYFKDDFRVNEGARIFNTWLGDPIRIHLLEKNIEVIRNDNLLNLVEKSGAALFTGINELMQKHGDKLFNLRGVGTFIAFDIVSTEKRSILQQLLLEAGVYLGACGQVSCRLRPCLNFGQKHTQEFLEKLDSMSLSSSFSCLCSPESKRRCLSMDSESEVEERIGLPLVISTPDSDFEIPRQEISHLFLKARESPFSPLNVFGANLSDNHSFLSESNFEPEEKSLIDFDMDEFYFKMDITPDEQVGPNCAIAKNWMTPMAPKKSIQYVRHSEFSPEFESSSLSNEAFLMDTIQLRRVLTPKQLFVNTPDVKCT